MYIILYSSLLNKEYHIKNILTPILNIRLSDHRLILIYHQRLLIHYLHFHHRIE